MTYDLTTLAGQAQHYAAVRDRLWRPKPIKVTKAIEPPPRPAWTPAVPPSETSAPFDFYSIPTWQNILRFVSLKTGVPERLIMSREKTVAVVYARYMTMALMKRHMDVSLPMIGRRWDFDHTSVRHGIHRYESGELDTRLDSCKSRRVEREQRIASAHRSLRGPVARWTQEKLDEAKAMRASGLMLKEIAEHFDVTPNAMQAAMKREAIRAAAAASEAVQ
jgi:hypothetical protein